MTRPLLDADAFIRRETRLLPVPLVPEIRLHLAEESIPLWEKTEEELAEIGLPPPFWAFAWAGGQALARYVLDRPDLVRGRSVLDVAAGSGLVGIAAAKAGAARVTCVDIDPFAAAAQRLNAMANGVTIEALTEDFIGARVGHDVILAGDIYYEAGLSLRMVDWLAELQARGAAVLIGDPGRSYLPADRLEAIARYAVPVTRDLEDAEIKRSAVWRLKP